MKSFAKFAALLLPVVAACGGATNADQRALEAECSYTLPANASALHVQRALNAALDGSFDPCGGAVDRAPSMNVALQRIDAAMNADGQHVLSLVFRMVPDRDALDRAVLDRAALDHAVPDRASLDRAVPDQVALRVNKF